MENQLVIKSAHGAFHAYIARPAKLPSPAVVVLQELFGVNADIRATCDELATQGFIAVAPEQVWRKNLESILMSDLTQTGSTVCNFTRPMIAMPALKISGKRSAQRLGCRNRPEKLPCKATASAR